jgi:hypothetical protein
MCGKKDQVNWKMQSLPSIIRLIMSRGMRLARHVAQMGRKWMHIGCLWENPKERLPSRKRRKRVDNIKMYLGYGLEWLRIEASERLLWIFPHTPKPGSWRQYFVVGQTGRVWRPCTALTKAIVVGEISFGRSRSLHYLPLLFSRATFRYWLNLLPSPKREVTV